MTLKLLSVSKKDREVKTKDTQRKVQTENQTALSDIP